jgi:diacylglycerol kinase family enzyme/membrane-associated phospholipid phosphatase
VSLHLGRPDDAPTTRLGGFQRRVRRLAPAPVRRADLALFRTVAGTRLPLIGRGLRPLTRAANHSRLWVAIAALLAALGGRFGRRAGLRGMVALGITSALTNLPAKLAAGRSRPDIAVVPQARRLARVPTSTSFPSGHSASAFAFATGASIELPALRLPLLGLAGSVAFSRIYTGAHYPGDVVVGSVIGTAVARATARAWPPADDRPATARDAPARPLPAADGRGLIVVANSGAGNALRREPEEELLEALPEARIITADPGEALLATLRRAGGQATALGVAGGDGSASAGAAIAHELGKPLVIVAAGTLNHLATDLGLDDVRATIAAVERPRAIAMDIAEIDGRPFVNAASIGVYPHLVDHRERLEQRIGKWPAVLVSLLRTLATERPYEVELNGRRRRVWLVFIGNCTFTEDGIAPTRRSRLDDGRLDVRIVSAEHPWARARVLLSLLTGRVGRCAAYERWSATELEVRSLDGPLQLARDGETWRGSTAFRVHKLDDPLVVVQRADVEHR